MNRKYERDLDDIVDGVPDVHGNYSGEESNMNEIGNVTKAMQRDKGVETEPFYRVGESDCGDGCCTPVPTSDKEGPKFDVATEHKAQLAAELLGVTLEELETALELRKAYSGWKKNGLTGFIEAI